MGKYEYAAKLNYLCGQLTGNEISPDGNKVYFNDPHIQRIVATAKRLLLTDAGRVSKSGVQALNDVAPHIHLNVIERSENYVVLYAELLFNTQSGPRCLKFIDI